MIGFISGKILNQSEGKLLIGVGTVGSGGSSGCVGYEVQVPQSPSYSLLEKGKDLELFVHTHVREDAFTLFGFTSPIEKEIFLTLISVNGIGPKGALGILSAMNPDDLVECILSQDKDRLTQVPGIGKKTAERMVLELQDPLKKKVDSGSIAIGTKSKQSIGQNLSASRSNKRSWPKPVSDARDALVGLGYKDLEIENFLAKWTESEEVQSTGVQNIRTEDVIRLALKNLGTWN